MTGMLEKSDIEQVDRSWPIIRNIWYALLGSLVAYLMVAKSAEDNLPLMEKEFPLELLKTILFGLAMVIFAATYLIRKAMLNTERSPASMLSPAPGRQVQYPAAGKYMTAIIVAMALSESIGVFGLVLFFLGKDSVTLYLFMTLSAIAMFYYRPRKEELMQLAVEMQKQGVRRQV